MFSLTTDKADDNIAVFRERYPGGLRFVVGDTHGEVQTLTELMKKIDFRPDRDHVYFVGDYNAGGSPQALLTYMARYYQADYAVPGFHLIRGNHERELDPYYPLENLPDIIVLRGECLNYYIVHAGMVASAFRLINEDMAQNPEQKVFAYSLEQCCVGWDAPLRQLIWSMKGLYSQKSRWQRWPRTEELLEKKACIIHGHTPYSFFMGHGYPYGDINLFWERQHIWFSEELCSFNIDSDVKGRNENGETYRGLTCVCLDVLEEIASRSGSRLTIDGLYEGENAVFGVPWSPAWRYDPEWDEADIGRVLQARPEMKTITIGPDRETPVLR